tara:strand:+ start:1462 stop:1884 length:423 start_codon:yes stop_codon:yes gene_type:complete
MNIRTILTATSIALVSTSTVLAVGAPAEAKDGCGRGYRFSYSQQRCVLRTDVAPNRRWQRKADRSCGKGYRFSYSQQRCVLRTDVAPNRRWQRKADRSCGKGFRFSVSQQRCVRKRDIGPLFYQPITPITCSSAHLQTYR